MKKVLSIILSLILVLSALSVVTAAGAESILYGDADGNGEVEIVDVTYIQRHLADIPTSKPINMQAAVVSGDDELSIIDATLIQRKLVGIISVFPVEEQQTPTEPKKDTLVVVFSRTGHTKPLAEYAAEYLEADFFEIEAAVPYTDADIAYYTNCRADQEQNDPTARPEIANEVKNMDQYNTIVLAYPIWHGQAPKIIYTFLESYDFSGKTIIPFCTSASSGIGSSATNLHALAPDAIWKDGRRFAIGTDEATIREWINSLGIKTEEAEESEMIMTINDTPVTVQWEDNEAVAALCEAVKDNLLTINMSMYGGFEQVGSLGMSLPQSDTRITTEAGDIVLYSGDQMVVFYGSNTWEYTRLGHITDKTQSELTQLLSNGNVIITLTY